MSSSEEAVIGRPRAFDEEVVLDRLVRLFWRQGYHQTTVAQIVQASGVHKPSLYRAFGAKEELFGTVLRRYLAKRMEMLAEMVEQAGSGSDAIQTFLDMFEAELLSERGRDGCLMIMASNELRGVLPGYDFSTDYRQQMGQQIQTLYLRAAPQADTHALQAKIDVLVTLLLGVQVIARAGADAAEIHRYFQAAHLALGGS